MRITNTSGISLALAVWLLHDTYDFIADADYISATSMMKPVRQTILRKRMNPEFLMLDVQDLIATSLGTAIHDSIEKAWIHNRSNALKMLGYPEDVVDAVRLNPTQEDVESDPNIIPVYLEQRLFTEFFGWKIGGKFDLVIDGALEDNKSTSAWAWVSGNKDDDYILQGSIYRWLDSRQSFRRITEDTITIHFIFTDWQKFQARSNPEYPQKRVESRTFQLMSLDETEAWIIRRLNTIKMNLQTKESDIPLCSPDELWMSDPLFKYYADPEKAKLGGKSTKNFNTLHEANAHLESKAGKGAVVTVPGAPKRCEYCDVFEICNQRKQWFPA